MDNATAKILYKLNNEFYAQNADSFSATRKSPWLGWITCANVMREHGLFADAGADNVAASSAPHHLAVLDVACGNMRFWEFLEEEFAPELAAGHTLTYYATDNCDLLAEPAAAGDSGSDTVTFGGYRNVDVVGRVLAGKPPLSELDFPQADIIAAFGFMHHIPGEEHRATVLSALVERTKPGGFILVSFWQFMKHAGLAKKAHATTAQATRELALPPLDAGDFIIGWGNKAHAYRYCHSFTEAEIAQLAAGVADRACVRAQFEADGRTNNLNTYLVLQKLPESEAHHV